ncbi:MAG: 30S ribosomal protein S12 methylthiotransferase RimO, partial [Deltaproteobacteria bacterium]|nr:30S ribosomal protein S12 methylthiotransferase RimO [Deltaproteobacteria bacterium]
DFEELLEFLQKSRFEHAGFFKFSPEEGARASKNSNQVPQKIKERRRRALHSFQRKISENINKNRINQSLKILIDGPSPEFELLSCGRASFQAPEVDGLIYFEGIQPESGKFVKATIQSAKGFDLLAHLDKEE